MRAELQLTILLAILFLTEPVLGQRPAPDFEWAVSSEGVAETWGMAQDAEGDVYVVGDAWAGSRFGPFELGEEGTVTGFVVKYDSSGQPEWGFHTGGPSQVTFNAVSVASDGLYAAGILFDRQGLADPSFGFGSSNYLVPPELSDQGVVARLNSEGEPLWVVTFGGDGWEGVFASATDSQDRLVCSARANSPFFQVNGIDVIRTNTEPDEALLIMRWKPNGELDWAKVLESNGRVVSEAIGVDAADNVIVAGAFAGHTLVFGGETVTNEYWQTPPFSRESAFVARLSASGDPIWIRTMARPDVYPLSVAVDGQDNALVVGTQGVSPWRSLLEKFEPDGTSQWAVAVESSDPVAFNKVAVDHDDNIFFAGTSSMEDLDINGLILEDDEGGHNAFVVKLRPDGRPRWGAQMTSLEHGQHVNGLTVDSAGNATVLAWFFNQSVQIGSYLLTNGEEHPPYSYLARLKADPPELRYRHSGEMLILSWPTNQPSFQLESGGFGSDDVEWQVVDVDEQDARYVSTNELSGEGRLFQLRKLDSE